MRDLLEFVVYYCTYSQDDSTIWYLKEHKSLETHDKLSVTSILLIHMTFGAIHDDHIQELVFQISSNSGGARNKQSGYPSNAQQVRTIQMHLDCHRIGRVVDEVPPQKAIIETLRGTNEAEDGGTR